MEENQSYEYWKLNQSKDISIFHDSVSGVTISCKEVVKVKEGGANSSSRFVQATQFGHIVPATAAEYEQWLQAKWDMDNPKELPNERPTASSKVEKEGSKKDFIPSEEELLDLTKPQLMDLIKTNKSIGKDKIKDWEKLSSEEIVPLYLATFKV